MENYKSEEGRGRETNDRFLWLDTWGWDYREAQLECRSQRGDCYNSPGER